jgi:predicted amino acid dehydrogenase
MAAVCGWIGSVKYVIMRLLIGKGADVNLTTTEVSGRKLQQCYPGD